MIHHNQQRTIGHHCHRISNRKKIGLSFILLSIALRVIPMAVAYAVWEGLGIVGIALIGHVLFGEHLTVARAAGLAAILAGILLIENGVGHERSEDHGRLV